MLLPVPARRFDALPALIDGTWRRLDGLLPVLAVRLRPFARV